MNEGCDIYREELRASHASQIKETWWPSRLAWSRKEETWRLSPLVGSHASYCHLSMPRSQSPLHVRKVDKRLMPSVIEFEPSVLRHKLTPNDPPLYINGSPHFRKFFLRIQKRLRSFQEFVKKVFESSRESFRESFRRSLREVSRRRRRKVLRRKSSIPRSPVKHSSLSLSISF